MNLFGNDPKIKQRGIAENIIMLWDKKIQKKLKNGINCKKYIKNSNFNCEKRNIDQKKLVCYHIFVGTVPQKYEIKII